MSQHKNCLWRIGSLPGAISSTTTLADPTSETGSVEASENPIETMPSRKSRLGNPFETKLFLKNRLGNRITRIERRLWDRGSIAGNFRVNPNGKPKPKTNRRNRPKPKTGNEWKIEKDLRPKRRMTKQFLLRKKLKKSNQRNSSSAKKFRFG